MASPFAVFRKHQKQLTVVLTGLAMFAFIILDGFRNISDATTLIPILTAAAFAGAFWMWGAQSEKRASMAVTGLLVGAVVGIVPVILRAGQQGVATSVGAISNEQMNEMQQDRRLANQFVQMAFAERKEARFMSPGRFMFGGMFGGSPVSRPEMVAKFLLLHEADQMNIHISDEYITGYIQEVSDGELDSRKRFSDLRETLDVPESRLFGVLRQELRARVALQLLSPPVVQMPEEYWQDFRKLNVRYTIDATAIPVEPFADRLEKPASGKLDELFNQFKNDFPFGDKPGFRQPLRQQLAWLEFDYSDFESQVGEIPKEEIDKRYEEQKAPKLDLGPEEDPGPSEDLNGDLLNPDGDAAEPNKESTPEQNGSKDSSDAPGEKQPAPKLPNPPTTPETSSPEKTNKSGETDPASGKPVQENPSQSSASEDSSSSSDGECQEEPAAEQPAASKTAAEESVAEESDPESKPATKQEPKPTPTKEGDSPAPKLPDNATTEKGPETAPALPDDAKPKQEPTGDSKGDEAGPNDDDEISEDELLRDQIRDELLREKTEELIKERVEEARREFRLLVSRLRDEIEDELDAKAKKLPDPKDDEERSQRREDREAERDRQMAKRLETAVRKLAKDKGLSYRQTEPVSASELQEHEQFVIGSATETARSNNLFAPRETVTQRVFSGSTSLFVASEAEDISRTRYIYWVARRVESHVPGTIKEPGVQEQVERAWRMIEGRPEAEKRAEAVADLVRDALKRQPAEGELPASMTSALTFESVTGEPIPIPETPKSETPEEAKPKEESSKSENEPAGAENNTEKPAGAENDTEKTDSDKASNEADEAPTKQGDADTSPEGVDEESSDCQDDEAGDKETPDAGAEETSDAEAEDAAETKADGEPESDDNSEPEAEGGNAEEAPILPVVADGPMQLSVISNSSFTWLRQSSSGMQMNPFMPQQPTIEFGAIPGVDNVDNDFMKTVSELKIGEVAVIPNSDATVYYVVHLKRRNPSDLNDPSHETMQQQFMREDVVFSPLYGNLAGSRFQGIRAKWVAEFMRRFEVNLDAVDGI